MLATGDGTPTFKSGSTNAYTEDSTGKPVYDWTIVDRIVDTYLESGAKPFIEIGFIPEALRVSLSLVVPIGLPDRISVSTTWAGRIHRRITRSGPNW